MTGPSFQHRLSAIVAIFVSLGLLTACHEVSDGKAATRAARVAIPYSTPQGITTIDVVRDQAGAQPELLWTRLGDSSGRTVLRHEAENNKPFECDARCAETFLPLYAEANAVAAGDWTLVPSREGSLQWAYQGDRLYTDTLEKEPGQIVSDAVCVEAKKADATNTIKCEVSKQDPPPAGWIPVHYAPEKSTKMPPRVSARRIPEAMGNVFVSDRGRTLYVVRPDTEEGVACSSANCGFEWLPYRAPSIGQPVGEFSIVERPDGSRQWAYKGEALYTFNGDNDAGDINGAANKAWGIAYLSRDFMPSQITIRQIPGRGIVLATADGNALYTRHAFDFRWGGRNLYHGFRNNYVAGKKLGVDGCTGPCLNDWKPLRAPADAVASGYWEPIVRPDGTKQWAYGGYALFTYTKDRDAGTVNGSNLFEYVAGAQDSRYAALKTVTHAEEPATPFAAGGAGLFWHISQP